MSENNHSTPWKIWRKELNSVSSVGSERLANTLLYFGFAFGIRCLPAKPINYAGKESILRCFFPEFSTNVAGIKVNP